MTIDDVLHRAADDLLAEVRSSSDTDTALADLVGSAARPRRGRLLAVAAAVLVLLGAAAVLVARSGDDGEGVIADTTTTTSTEPLRATGVPVTVTPATDLVDGQTVEVTVEGLDPDATVSLVMCPATVAADLVGAVCGLPSDAAPAGPDGTLTFSVRRMVPDGFDDPPLDCAVVRRCAVGVLVEEPIDDSQGRQGLVGATEVTFAEQPPQADPELTVDRAEDLRHGEEVTVTGAGFAGAVDVIEQCAFDALAGPCARTVSHGAEWSTGSVAAEGTFSGPVRVWRLIPSLDGATVDCAEVACVLRARGEDGRSGVTVPLEFDRSESAPEPPTMTATPTTGLRPGDPVTITMTGLAEGETVDLLACLLEGGGCGFATTFGAQVVGTGADSVVVTVPAVDPSTYGVDCSGAGTCALWVSVLGGSEAVNPLMSAIEPIPVTYAPSG